MMPRGKGTKELNWQQKLGKPGAFKGTKKGDKK